MQASPPLPCVRKPAEAEADVAGMDAAALAEHQQILFEAANYLEKAEPPPKWLRRYLAGNELLPRPATSP